MPNRRIAGYSIGFVAKVTLAAIVGILFLKFALPKLKIQGLTNAIQAV